MLYKSKVQLTLKVAQNKITNVKQKKTITHTTYESRHRNKRNKKKKKK